MAAAQCMAGFKKGRWGKPDMRLGEGTEGLVAPRELTSNSVSSHEDWLLWGSYKRMLLCTHEPPGGNSQAPWWEASSHHPGRSRCGVLGDSPRRGGRQLFTDLIWQIV